MEAMEKAESASKIEEAIVRAAKKMAVAVEDEAIRNLCEYAEELWRWNKAYNLVGRKIGEEGMAELFVDAISPLCIKGLLGPGVEVLDLGTGAGMPGLPLYMIKGPFDLKLVESTRKKVTFLRHVRRKLGLQGIDIYPGRMEDLAREEDALSAFDVILARAVMDPLKLMVKASPLLSEGGAMVVFLGRKDEDRTRKAKPDLLDKGLKVEAIRSTQRIVGKERYLGLIRKAKP